MRRFVLVCCVVMLTHGLPGADHTASAAAISATERAAMLQSEIVGAGVTSFNEQLSATQSITEIDINFNDTAGNYHIFVPNVTAAIASTHLYAAATTTVNADVTAGRFTVELEYSVF